MITKFKNYYFTDYHGTKTVNAIGNFKILVKFIKILEQSKLSSKESLENLQTRTKHLRRKKPMRLFKNGRCL